MSPTIGRPKSESPKDTMLRVRLDEVYCQKLEHCATKLNLSKSDDYKWTERQGYSDEEIAMFEELLLSFPIHFS